VSFKTKQNLSKYIPDAQPEITHSYTFALSHTRTLNVIRTCGYTHAHITL